MPNGPLRRVLNHQSSPVTKGMRMFVAADGRTAWARRWNDLVILHANDLGGFDVISEAQLSICRRVSAIEAELEGLEGRLSAGQPVELALYARLTGCLCRLLELVGITRLAKPMDPLGALAEALGPCPPTVPEDDEEA